MSGIGWPWTSSPVWIEINDSVADGFRALMKTRNGERKKKWIWGGQLMQIVFENKGPVLEALANRELAAVFSQNLPDSKIKSIDYTYDDNNEKPVEILVKYEYLGETGEVSLPVTQE